MNEEAPVTQETPEDRRDRLTNDHMNYQLAEMKTEGEALDKEQTMKERIQKASPDDIHWAINTFTDRNVGAILYLKDKVQEEAEARGIKDLDDVDHDARDAIFDEIMNTTENGRKLMELEDDSRKSTSASRLVGEWHGLPETSRGTFSSYVSNEMLKAREAAANNGGTDRLDEVGGAGKWCGKFLGENLRDYYNSGVDRTGEVRWDSYVPPIHDQAESTVSS